VDNIVVKTYKTEKAYQRDANRMRDKGYEIHNMDQSERMGCWRYLLFGPLALLWKPNVITVTYRLTE